MSRAQAVKIIVGVSIALTISSLSGAQNIPIGYFTEKKQTKIPFELVNNLIIVKGEINGRKDQTLIIDTGSSVSIIFSDDSLNLTMANKFLTVRGYGQADSVRAPISIYNQFKLDDLVGHNLSAVVLKKKDFPVDQILGLPISGIIGYDLFAQHQVTINFISKRIIITQQEHSRCRFEVPIQIERNVPTINAVLTNEEGQLTSARLTLDTGSDVPLLLNSQWHPSESIPITVGFGLMGYSYGHLGKIPELTFGQLTLKDFFAAFPSDSKREDSLGIRGNLGSNFFKNNVVQFDYPSGKFCIRFPLRIARQPLAYNRSGISVVKKKGPFGGLVVDFVAPQSIGEQAGLKEGDRIIAVSEIAYPRLTLAQARALLSDMSLDILEIHFERNGKFHKVELPLEGK